MPEQLKNKINHESLKNALRNKVNKKFNRLRNARVSLESDWVRIHEAIQEGYFLESGLRERVGKYVDLRDNNFSTLVSKELAQKLAFIQPDGFQLQPKPYSAGTGEIVRTDAIEHYLKDKFKSENCKWYSSWHDALYQLIAFNFGIVHYSFTFKSEPKYKQEYRFENGNLQLNSYAEESELVYQGTVLDYINLFNFYLDAGDYNFSDLYALDTFYREAVNFQDVLSDSRFDPSKPYVNDNFVIYRDNQSIKDLTGAEYQRSEAEVQLDRLGSQEEGSLRKQEDTLKNYLEVRTCYLKQLKIQQEDGQESILNNICVVYATTNDDVYPLLVEFNTRPYNQKPYIYLPGFKNGVTVYGSSNAGRAYSDHARSAFNNCLEAYTAGEAVFSTEYIDSSFLSAYAGSRQQFEEAWKTPGSKEYIDLRKWRESSGGGTEPFVSPQRDRAMQLLPLVKDQKNTARSEMQNDMSQVAMGAMSGGTAAAVKYQAGQEDLFMRHFKEIVGDGFKKIIKLTIDDYKKLQPILKPENVLKDINNDELQSLLSDLSSGKIEEGEDGNLYQQETIETEDGQMPIITGVNINTKQKYMTLMPWFWNQLDVGIDIKIEGVDFDRMFKNEEITKMFDLAEKLQIPELGLLAVQQYVAINDIPNTDKILALVEQKTAQMNQPPDPMEQQMKAQQIQNQTRASEAKVLESEARAKNLDATANQKNLETQATLEQEQAKQQILGLLQPQQIV